MKPRWKQADLFPVIACVIEQAYREFQRFITHQEIIARLLQDTEGHNLVEAAKEQREDEQSLELLASNMIAWFSARIAMGKLEWAQAFERKKIDGGWAYKCREEGRKSN